MGRKSTASFDVQVVYERVIDVAAERERLTKDMAKLRKGSAGGGEAARQRGVYGEGTGAHCRWATEAGAETRLLYDKSARLRWRGLA